MESLLFSLALLACPVGMGLMMWMMMRGSRPHSPSPTDRSDELAQLRSEIDQLRRDRSGSATHADERR
jgi:hypothetical protein